MNTLLLTCLVSWVPCLHNSSPLIDLCLFDSLRNSLFALHTSDSPQSMNIRLYIVTVMIQPCTIRNHYNSPVRSEYVASVLAKLQTEIIKDGQKSKYGPPGLELLRDHCLGKECLRKLGKVKARSKSSTPTITPITVPAKAPLLRPPNGLWLVLLVSVVCEVVLGAGGTVVEV